jgi:hypothetical protein
MKVIDDSRIIEVWVCSFWGGTCLTIPLSLEHYFTSVTWTYFNTNMRAIINNYHTLNRQSVESSKQFSMYVRRWENVYSLSLAT